MGEQVLWERVAMKKIFNITLAAVIAFSALVILGGCNSTTSTLANTTEDNTDTVYSQPSADDESTTVWREVPITPPNELATVERSYYEFDLRKLIAEGDFAFLGTIVACKEYEVSWVDEAGYQVGPIRQSVMEVRIDRIYHGTSPVDGDTIRVYYAIPISWQGSNEAQIRDGASYVFVTKVMDEAWVTYKKEHYPEDRNEHENHADVLSYGPMINMFPVENGTVFLRCDWFLHKPDVLARRISVPSDLVPIELLEYQFSIALSIEDFEAAFLELYENSESLPTLAELNDLRASFIEDLRAESTL